MRDGSMLFVACSPAQILGKTQFGGGGIGEGRPAKIATWHCVRFSPWLNLSLKVPSSAPAIRDSNSKTRTRATSRVSFSTNPRTMSRLSVEEALDEAGDNVETACAQLWHLDVNRLRAGVDYELDLQERSRGMSHDAARVPLFARFERSVWERTTYSAFWRLLDNYTAETGVREHVTRTEAEEEMRFLRAVVATPIGGFTRQWLSANTGFAAGDDEEFIHALDDLWFGLYRRDESRDSSAFEHVMCGELDDGKVKGMHNFIQVLREENSQRFDYHGYLPARGRRREGSVQPDPRHQLLTVRFEWLGHMKTASSMFVGTSPEFELCLYTLMFAAELESATLDIGPYTAKVKVYPMRGKIGSAYPELISIDEDELEGQWNIEAQEAAQKEPEPAPEPEPEPEQPTEEIEEAEASEGFSYADALRG